MPDHTMPAGALDLAERYRPKGGELPGVAGSRTSLGRTNAEWLETLRRTDCATNEAAVEELRAFLRAGLAKTFGGHQEVPDDDLDDFTQEAIVRILGNLGSFRGRSRFTTWGMTIALRVGYTALRRRQSAHVSLDDLRDASQISWMPGSASCDPSRRVEREELLMALRTAIDDRLTERQRTVILSELHGVPSERVADLLGTNRNAVYKVYHDARRKLRAALREVGFTKAEVRDLWEETR